MVALTLSVKAVRNAAVIGRMPNDEIQADAGGRAGRWLVPAPAAAYAKPDANQLAAVADKGRPEADTKRDADRKPAEMLEFAGVKPGQTVVDLIPGGGYFTRIFSKAVGPKGTVYAVGGPPRPAPIRPSRRRRRRRTPSPPIRTIRNVKSVHVPLLGGLSIPTKADVSGPRRTITTCNEQSRTSTCWRSTRRSIDALKPGGVFIVARPRGRHGRRRSIRPTSCTASIRPS